MKPTNETPVAVTKPTVFIARYEHKHGTDLKVFSARESAEFWGDDIARDYWNEWMGEELMPQHPRHAYFDRAGSSEYFSVVEHEIYGPWPWHAHGEVEGPRKAPDADGVALLMRVREKLSGRLLTASHSKHEGYDHSIVCFNKAWDIALKVFEEELEA